MIGVFMMKVLEEMNKCFRVCCEVKGLEDGNKSFVFGWVRIVDYVKSIRGWVGWVESVEQKGSDQFVVCFGVVVLFFDVVF